MEEPSASVNILMFTNELLFATTRLIGKMEEVVISLEDHVGGLEVFVEDQLHKLEEGLMDVVEAIDRKVVIEAERKHWTYRTVGQGIDIVRRGWSQEGHVLTSQSRDVSKSLPGRPAAAHELGPPKKVQATILNLLSTTRLLKFGLSG
jgi:hypothetical protein